MWVNNELKLFENWKPYSNLGILVVSKGSDISLNTNKSIGVTKMKIIDYYWVGLINSSRKSSRFDDNRRGYMRGV